MEKSLKRQDKGAQGHEARGWRGAGGEEGRGKWGGEGGKKNKSEKKQWEAKREDWQKDVASEEVTIEATETVTAPEA